eukprot:CAMPEP_0184870126 /NCGR_PEP_ID=MMETSP0580-20130426/36555_1 /TAXON_ID=1118495 /ORGANISM="Dactyliosolen fragilissimus" /LENGTH=389 /DNA_ID=CAMNT_0027372051 /DNA_START=45 /DNA_END=1214 /DNA_ORIENTATION=+
MTRLLKFIFLAQFLVVTAKKSSSYNPNTGQGLMNPGTQLFNEQMITLLEPVTLCMSEDPNLAAIIAQNLSVDESGYYPDLPTKMVNAIPPLLDIMDNYCDEKDTNQFENALKDFQKCSRIDLMTYYETLYDSMAGATFYCARYIFDALQSTSIPRVPDQCMDALFGDNPTGNTLRAALEHPGLDSKCYHDLYDNLPTCTIKKWPLPLSGSLLKVVSCINKKSMPLLEESCAQDFDAMNECLNDPKLLLGKPRSQEMCDEWTQACSGFSLFLPPPLNALPLSDVCQHKIDLEPKVKEKYEAYRKSCVSPDDIHYWEEGDGKASLSSLKYYSSNGREGGKGNSILYTSFVSLGFISLFALVMYGIIKGNDNRPQRLDADDAQRLDRTVELS